MGNKDLTVVEPEVRVPEVVNRTVFEGLNLATQKKILGIETDINSRLLNIKTDIYMIGKLLSQAKGILPHGTYQRWVEETWEKELPYQRRRILRASTKPLGRSRMQSSFS
jgi:hypothetical protein